MAFWGVYLIPSEPYTLHYDDAVPKRLRITQATLGDATRNSPTRSIVRCSVGDKPAIAICSLSVKELTCCQLELEFEESHDVVFSVVGPRGVYLAGYLIAPAPTAPQHSIDHKEQEKVNMEIVGCSDQDLHNVELDFNKTGPVEESPDAQNTDIQHSEGGECLLKCFRDRNKEGKNITLDQKMGEDVNEDSCGDEHQEKTMAVKTPTVFDRLIAEKRGAIQKKKKRKRRRKMKPVTSEATASEYVNDLCVDKFGSNSRLNLENGISPDAHERSHDKVKKRKKKNKRILMGRGQE